MDLELIRTLTFCQTKNLVNADSQIFRPVSIILLQSWPKLIKAQSIPNDTVRLRVQYLLDIVKKYMYISIHQRASDTDETSYGAVSGEKHGRTLIKLYIF
jgi:hypothetical protein